MLKLHLLGYAHVSQGGERIPLSVKGTALLAYLALEDRPHHRDHLADLLWSSADALRNLRVELSHLRRALPSLLPPGLPMLSVQLGTDLSEWLRQGRSLREAQLTDWLSLGSGLPLSGLEDVGSKTFQGWVDHRRWGIHREIEKALSSAHAGFVRRGLADAAERTLACMRQLGMKVQATPEQPARPRAFGRSRLTRQFQAVLALARQRPQLVVIQGRSGAGRRELIDQGLLDSDWSHLEMQVSQDAPAQHAAFLHQLLPVLSAEPQSEVRMLLTHAQHTPQDLIRAWTLLAASGQPLVIAFHDIPRATPELLASWHFAMNLTCPLTLVLLASPLGSVAELRRALGPLDASRVHLLTVGPLSVREVMQAAGRQQPLLAPEQGRALATLIVQQSEGWAAHAHDLLGNLAQLRGSGGGARPLSEAMRERLLRDLHELDPEQTLALTRLSVLHSPVDPGVAELLLGAGAPAQLADLERLGLLAASATTETVQMPALSEWPTDLEGRRGVVNEPLRTALSGSLPAIERRALCARLAAHYRGTDTVLAAYYARRAGLDTSGTEGGPETAPPEVPRVPTPPGAWDSAPAADLPEPPADGPPAREHRTANGYRVTLEGGQLMVLRSGLLARLPRLNLRWPAVPAGRWRMVARLDAYADAPDFGASAPGYALGVRVGAGPVTLYTTAETHEEEWPGGDAPAVAWGGRLPLGRWFTLRGEGGAGELELSVRALDIALSVSEWQWGDTALLPHA